MLHNHSEAGQATHFESVFACAKRAGYWDDSRVRINHVGFRVVLGVQEELMAAQTNVGMAGCIKYADLSHYIQVTQDFSVHHFHSPPEFPRPRVHLL